MGMSETVETLQVHAQEARVLRSFIEARNAADRDLQTAFVTFLAAHGYKAGTLKEITGDTVVVSGLEAAP